MIIRPSARPIPVTKSRSIPSRTVGADFNGIFSNSDDLYDFVHQQAAECAAVPDDNYTFTSRYRSHAQALAGPACL